MYLYGFGKILTSYNTSNLPILRYRLGAEHKITVSLWSVVTCDIQLKIVMTIYYHNHNLKKYIYFITIKACS